MGISQYTHAFIEQTSPFLEIQNIKSNNSSFDRLYFKIKPICVANSINIVLNYSANKAQVTAFEARIKQKTFSIFRQFYNIFCYSLELIFSEILNLLNIIKTILYMFCNTVSPTIVYNLLVLKISIVSIFVILLWNQQILLAFFSMNTLGKIERIYPFFLIYIKCTELSSTGYMVFNCQYYSLILANCPIVPMRKRLGSLFSFQLFILLNHVLLYPVILLFNLMGACYSYGDAWVEEDIKVNVKKKNKKKRKKQASVIIQEKSNYEKSFASNLEGSFREDLYETLDNMGSSASLLQSSMAMGSVLQMTPQQQQNLFRNLINLNPNSQPHKKEKFRLCNFKTKNFLHTHKIKLQKYPHYYEVSACPYNSTHTLEYDIWQFKEIKDDDFYIYHPFTERYLTWKNHQVCTSQDKFAWTIKSLGVRRNTGFIRIECAAGQLCMTDEKALVKNHRQVSVCSQMHISHLWELLFNDNI